MQTKQTIAIVGATGKMGGALAGALAKGNYRLLLLAGDGVKVQAVVDAVKSANPSADVEAVGCAVDACWEADIIIVAVPYKAEKEVAGKIREVANQKIVVSIANPLAEDFSGLATAPGTSAAEELQALLPHSKVVKAFNTTFAADFGTPVIDGRQVDAFVAGDDDEAVQTASELVLTAGFNPVVAGNLKVSRTLEAMQLLLIQLTLKNKYNWLAGWKILHQ